jgi:large subunit ribosomal protein L13
MAKKGEVAAKWHLVDAQGLIVGRIATRIAMILMGKHRPTYTPHVDTGDFVVIINADKVRVTGGNKPKQRLFENYSKYPGGRRVTTHEETMAKRPEKVIYEAIRCMLPKTKMGMAMITKLKVYAGAEHPHQAQMPEKLDL